MLMLGKTPDAFSFAILDSTLAPLPTTGSPLDAFLLIDIDRPRPVIETFRTSDASPVQLPAPQVSIISPVPVPDTGSPISMLLMGLGAVWCFGRGFLHRA